MKSFPFALFLLAFAAFAPPPSAAQDPELQAALQVFQQIGPEGEGNAEAATAWGTLTERGSEMLLPTLAAMEGASPMARNWMRSAVEAVFEREHASGQAVPAASLKAFVLDRRNEPNARRLAFDLYAVSEPDSAAALVPGMIDDPSTALRRDAVALLIAEGRRQLGADEREAAIATFRKALDASRDVDQIQEIARRLRDDLEQSVNLPRHFGFLTHWHLIAPFDNTDRAGYDTVYPPETEIDLGATYPGKDGQEVSWQKYATSDDFGMVDFNDPFSPLKQVVGYAYAEYESAEAREVELRLGCKNAWKIWFNGELIFGRDEYHRGMRIDQYVLPVSLKPGRNTILVKACQNEQEQDWTVEWRFQVRVCDPTGTAVLATNRLPTPRPEAPERRRRVKGN